MTTSPLTNKDKDLVVHKNNFNFLRLFLAIFVIISHSAELIDGNRDREILTQIFYTLSFGELAVNGFFLLSGYLIVQSWERAPQLFDFLKKRILRIYPAFIVVCFICAFVIGPLVASSPDYFTQLNLPDFLQRILLLKSLSLPPIFAGQPYPDVNGSLWTISYEFRCYLMVAILGMCGIVKRPRIWLGFTTLVIVLSLDQVLVSKIAFPGSGILIDSPPLFIRLLSFFLAGGCFYLFRQQIQYKLSWVLVGIPIVILAMFNTTTISLFLPTVGGYIFFWFAFLYIPMLQKFGKTSDVSYGLYLYGWPTQKLWLWYCPWLSIELLFLLSTIGSYLCGLLSWHLVEKHFLRFKKKSSSLPLKKEA